MTDPVNNGTRYSRFPLTGIRHPIVPPTKNMRLLWTIHLSPFRRPLISAIVARVIVAIITNYFLSFLLPFFSLPLLFSSLFLFFLCICVCVWYFTQGWNSILEEDSYSFNDRLACRFLKKLHFYLRKLVAQHSFARLVLRKRAPINSTMQVYIFLLNDYYVCNDYRNSLNILLRFCLDSVCEKLNVSISPRLVFVRKQSKM